MSGRKRFRGKVVYTGGIVSQSAVFREKIDTGNPATAPVGGGGGGGGGAGGLAWDNSAPPVAIKEFGRAWLTNGSPAKLFVGGGGDIYLGNAIGAESITYSASGLASGLSIDSNTGQLLGTANPVGYSNVTVTASDGSSSITKNVYVLQRSQVNYTTAGTYDFIVPDFVDEISAVCIGGGGTSNASPPSYRAGAGGGGLRWISNMPVIPGETLTVVAGDAGSRTQGVPTNVQIGGTGGTSSISRGATILIQANGGSAPGGAGGGTTIGSYPYGVIGGGNGGGAISSPSPAWGAGAAGGYNSAPTSAGPGPNNYLNIGAGGAGCTRLGFGGSGVGLFGQGQSGAGGHQSLQTAHSGGGAGSAGNAAQFPTATVALGPGAGGLYGGGGTARNAFPVGTGVGGRGAVRIIWGGQDRQYPGTHYPGSPPMRDL